MPFRDATNGETTCPAGRYLDLDPGDDRAGGDEDGDGDCGLDLNRA
jgi:uncharacterized protein (DUF1684 family)